MDFLEWLRNNGDACTIESALDRISRDALDQLAGAGLVRTDLRGWVSRAGAFHARHRALRFGGVLSCTSALEHYGAWTPTDERMHIRIVQRTHSDRTRASAERDDVVAHRASSTFDFRRPRHAIDGPVAALATASRCVGPLDLVTIAGDALAKRLVGPSAITELAARVGRAKRIPLEAMPSAIGSGAEARFFEHCRRARVRLQPQVQVLPGIRVDFLIGRVVIEIDSRRWHSGNERYEIDRRRDAALHAAGYRVLRFTYQQVMFEPESIVAQLRAVLASR